MGGFAWVTLATNDSYSLGALVLAHSLKRVGTKYDLAVLITPGVTEVMREKLSSVFSLVKEVNVLDSKDEANLALLARPELGITFTKLHCWRLTQYDKCVFIDADTLVIKNSDELFERDELSAAPDVGWPDCFNSGVFVFKPSQNTFASLTSHAKTQGSFDGGDQGLLNSFFSDWSHKDISKHLPFIYNMCSTATYSYLPAFKQFGDDVKIIHFIGSTKPWLQYFDTLTGQVQPHSDTGYLQPMLQHWWNIFCENVHPQLSPVMASSTLATTHWHNLQYPVSSKPTLTRNVCHDTTIKKKIIHDEPDAVPDFTNFRDPWEYYIVSTPENPIAHSSQQIPQSQLIQSQNIQQNNQDDIYQISQTMNNMSINQENNNTNNNINNENISNQSTHDYPNYQLNDNQLSNIKNNDCVNNSSLHKQQQQSQLQLQSQPSTSRQIDNNHVEYTRHQLPQLFDGIDETDKISNKKTDKKLNNDISITLDNENFNTLEHDNKHNDNYQINTNTKSQIQKCTESNCVASQSDMTSNIEHNAGIAGALAKITLGETRSSEQVALEEHMRKYGWEQGQIDYMGRDSFDNIWKKISTTLDNSSSKNDKIIVKEKSEEKEEKIPIKAAEKLTEEIAKNISDETKKIDAAAADEILENKYDLTTEQEKEKIKLPVNEAKEILSTSPTSESLPVSSEPVLALKTPPPVLSIKEHGEIKNDNKITQIEQSKILKSQDELNVSVKNSVIPLGFTSTTTEEDIKSEIIKESTSKETKSEIEQPILPIPDESIVKDSSLESKKNIETLELENKIIDKSDYDDEKNLVTEELNEIEKNILKISNEFLSDDQTLIDKKDMKIPATPTIIEATPPTSPQCEKIEEEIQQAPKKIARKIIKKQKSNQDDDAIEGTSDNNTKSTINIDDKKKELNENLEPDERVPETPPPASINPPTPPKRKSKTSTNKNTTKKNE